MKKTLLVIPVVVLLASLVLAVTAFAGCCDPDPCCGCEADCSPGFWKNHTELWYDDPQWADPEFMLMALKAKGNDEVYRPYRFEVADWLNEAYPNAPCD